MKYFYLIVVFIVGFSCKTDKKSGYDPYPLPVPEQNSLLTGWEKKIVLDSSLLDDMEQDGNWSETGIGEISYTNERSKDGQRSLRFRTSMRNTAYMEAHRTKWDTFDGVYGGTATVTLRFDKPQDWSVYNRLSFWVYVHPTSMPTYTLVLWISNIGKGSDILRPSRGHIVTDLKPGMWNHVLFEIPHLERDSVNYFSIAQHLRGHNPEEEGIVTYDIDQLELQVVNADPYEGWSVAPEKFSFSHTGYRPGDPKIAMVGSGGEDHFNLVDQNDSIVFEGKVEVIENKNGSFKQLDFTALQKEGTYRIRCGSLESGTFVINEDIWLDPVFKAVNFYFCERCGYEVPGIHLECHKDWIGFHGDVKKVINGGWHDAGDLSQGAWRTAMGIYAMLRSLGELRERKNAEEIRERLSSEIAWGLEWLLKTRFGDGYHMSWSTMRIYTDNKIGTIDDVRSPAQNVPWENFLASAVECMASEMLKKSHPELAGRARIAAIEDWQAAVDSREILDNAEYKEAAWAVTSSVLLGKMTGDLKYKEKAVHYCDLLMKCQEQNFMEDIPITGFFYSNTTRNRIIHNNHTAFEEAAMIALSTMCREYPDHENWISWYSSAVIYSEFFLKRGSLITAPYYYLPNSVWKRSEIMAVKDENIRRDMLSQFNDGILLSDEYALRTFPIYNNGGMHGSTNSHLSFSWALAEASGLRKDQAGMNLVGKQLQWIMGDNPFCQSLMYGVGYDFPPLSAIHNKNFVGAIPCGIDCMSGNKPYWPATNYTTFKEIWTETNSRFLGAVSVYALKEQSEPEIDLGTETVRDEKGTITINVTATGRGIHELEIKVFNCETNFESRKIDLTENKIEKIQIELEVTDKNKPYVAVILADNDPLLRSEITGALINSSVLEK